MQERLQRVVRINPKGQDQPSGPSYQVGFSPDHVLEPGLLPDCLELARVDLLTLRSTARLQQVVLNVEVVIIRMAPRTTVAFQLENIRNYGELN